MMQANPPDTIENLWVVGPAGAIDVVVRHAAGR